MDLEQMLNNTNEKQTTDTAGRFISKHQRQQLIIDEVKKRFNLTHGKGKRKKKRRK